jgi:hypothetical protein
MGSAIRHGRTLRANLCEVERGVFYATYSDCVSVDDTDELTTYQVGTCVADAKRSIEACALALGYDSVLWTETIVVPLFASQAKTALHARAAKYTLRRGA